ncbi:hypothetical protein [Streptomyces sp. Je 1-369]|uniref:hypothetical protein n=1 Tax=Streptomyces sp. Je 1-369 TaxID=2966192 RepID=UPI002285E9D3|nr:hypothetical protein [Streptomyces sp. Je 1-369]WAL93272.1 hypothetical protein NOO62_01465 [Streptomyces sp. Je 1-369]
MATAQQVQEKLGGKLLGVQREGPGVPIEVQIFRVSDVFPVLLIEIDVRVADEVWRVSLNYKGQEASLVSGDLAEETVDYLALLVRTHLFEWWHTKDTERAAKRMGTRLE